MCGICGAVSLEGPLDRAIARSIGAMTHALRHRGPDSQRWYEDERAVLGHARLAIIDRVGGEQPMTNEDGTVLIVFNGEVYNHADLRQDLTARGHVFRTRSDTEAIVHAWEEYGPACVERLEGMFAFAIHDRRTGDFFLARDRLGKKPLFYMVRGGALHFASEMKAIAASPAFDPETDLSALEGYLSLGYFLAPATVYRHVRKLEPGSWLHVRRNAGGGHGSGTARIEGRRYWDVERFDDDWRPVKEIAAEFEARLRHAVHERLESEVPLGAFLSGGIDSGLVVSYMAEVKERRGLVTTSVGFDDAGHNELDAALLTARRFDTHHHAEVSAPRLDEVFDPIVAAFDEPFADSSAIPTFYVSQMARRHVTVALSGDGGDEVFGGYDFRYVPHALEAMVRRVAGGSTGRRFFSGLARRWPRSRSLPRPLRLGTLFENLGRTPEDAYYLDLCFLKPAAARALLGQDPAGDPRRSPVYAAVTDPYRRCPSRSAVQRAQYADLKVYLPNDVLVKVDRMSMQHSLEVRCPLLDRRVVEAAFRVPTARKMPGLRRKHILYRLARERLPRALLTLPKRGFTAPVGAWIAGPSAGAFADEVLCAGSNVGSLVDARRVRALFEEHRSGKADHAYALWALWVLERWSRRRKGEVSARAPEVESRVVSPFGVSVSSAASAGGRPALALPIAGC